MELLHVKPMEIEKRSFEIIEKELTEGGIILKQEEAPFIMRAIHTSADFDYAKTLVFTDGAVTTLCQLIKSGVHIVTDTNMAFTGINKKELGKYGCTTHCYMADEDVARLAKDREVTRASISMEKAMQENMPTVFVVGNAPTALIRLRKAYDEEGYRPAFIIGVPVGFVNVEAAKELILETDIPSIINLGRKGGSNVAAALVNAALYELRKETAINK